MKPLIHCDEIYLDAKNLEQEKYQKLMKKMCEISHQVGYDILNVSNDKIIPVSEMSYEDKQKVVILDDYVCEKNQRQLIDYFLQGRHKNCSVIYLSQSFYKTPKDIRMNCSHYCVYEFPSSRESNMISSELGVDKQKFKTATREPFSFLYVDKPKKKHSKITSLVVYNHLIKWEYLTNNLLINHLQKEFKALQELVLILQRMGIMTW